MTYESIFISDIHLGTRFSKAEQLLDFIKHNDAKTIYLVGDIIDGWALKRKFKWRQSHSDVVQKLLKASRKGTKIVFITGNHDEFLRPYVPLILGEHIKMSNSATYKALNGKTYYITHGDFFDSITMTKKWLAVLGDKGYDFLLHVNQILHFIRKKMGIKKYWSLSKYVKDNIKRSVSFITDFENVLANHAKRKGFDGVICGHIHKAEMRHIDDIEYFNCGDWVESCTAVVESLDGQWEIVEWMDHYK